jgi:hypothetical protein
MKMKSVSDGQKKAGSSRIAEEAEVHLKMHAKVASEVKKVRSPRLKQKAKMKKRKSESEMRMSGKRNRPKQKKRNGRE